MFNLKRNTYLKFFSCLFLILIVNTIYCAPGLKLEFGRNIAGGPLSIDFLRLLKDNFNADTFIETGTHLGLTAKNAAQVFDLVKTIELSEELYQKAKADLSVYKNAKVYNGDSAILLKELLKSTTGKAIIWLDGHYSGFFNGNNTALGNTNTPIIAELKCIKEAGISNSVILIDDIRLFDKFISKLPQLDIGGYPDISEMCSLLLDINPDYQIIVMSDMLMAFEKKENITISDVLKAYSFIRITSNFHSKEFIEAEETIGNASGEELDVINTLYRLFCSHEHFTKYGIGSHYALLYVLTLLKNKEFYKAINILEGPINLGIEKDYICDLRMRINRAQS